MNRNRHSIINSIFWFLALLTISSVICLAGDAPSYQGAAEKCDQEIQAKFSKLSDNYASALGELMETFRINGDLEKTLAVKKEKDRFALEKTLEIKNVVEVPPQLQELQKKFLAAPKTVAQEIAKSYVVQLEEIKRKLTIDSKLSEAIEAKGEIDKIQKKYAVVNPTAGGEFRGEDMPKVVTMTESVSIPVIVDGQTVGMTGLHRGATYKLVKVDGPQVVIRVDKSNIVVPVEQTDLLNRIERKQKGLPDESESDSEALAQQPAPERIYDKLGRAWQCVESGDWPGTWRRRENTKLFDVEVRNKHNGVRQAWVVKVSTSGSRVTAVRVQGEGVGTTYDLTISQDGRQISGKVQGRWGEGTFVATIVE